MDGNSNDVGSVMLILFRWGLGEMMCSLLKDLKGKFCNRLSIGLVHHNVSTMSNHLLVLFTPGEWKASADSILNYHIVGYVSHDIPICNYVYSHDIPIIVCLYLHFPLGEFCFLQTICCFVPPHCIPIRSH